MTEVACVRLLVAPGGGSGIVLMREVRRQYPKDPQLSHNMARVLAAMAKYGTYGQEGLPQTQD